MQLGKIIGWMFLKKIADKKNIHALRWEVYVKEKEKLIKREFLMSVPYPKEGEIVWTCVKKSYHR